MILKSRKFAALALGTALAGFVLNNARAETSPDAVLDHYADMAEAAYSDSLAAAQTLDAKIEAMMADPSPETLKAARAEKDDTRRRELLWECQAILSADGGMIAPVWADYLDAKSSKVSTPEVVAGDWDLDGNRAPERWWFNA